MEKSNLIRESRRVLTDMFVFTNKVFRKIIIANISILSMCQELCIHKLRFATTLSNIPRPQVKF